MYKSRLHELCQKKRWELPIYITGKNGPCHMPGFTATVTVQGQVFATPEECKSLKEAHNSAARIAFDHFNAPPQVAANGSAPPSSVNSQIPTADAGAPLPVAAPPPEMQPTVDVLPPSPLPSSLPSPPPGPVNREVLQENHADAQASAVNTEPANGEVLKENHADPQASAVNISIGSHDEGHEGLLLKKNGANTKPVNGEVLLDNHADGQTAAVNMIPISSHDRGYEAGLSMYKSQLQQYAQKNKLCLPAYTTEAHGPPHNSRFKSKVCLDGKSYETPEFFSTLKEAEQVAAKVACQALSVAVVQEDGGFSKNILQELSQKRGLLCPSYETVSSGMSHSPTFVSAVTIGTDSFRGDEAKTKKQAEINAAKVAYFALTKGDAVANSSKVPTATVRKHQDTANEGPERDAKRAKASLEG